MNWIDRRIRRDYWLHYGVPHDALNAARQLDLISAKPPQDEQWEIDQRRLRELCVDYLILMHGSPAHRKYEAMLIDHIHLMVERYGQPAD